MSSSHTPFPILHFAFCILLVFAGAAAADVTEDVRSAFRAKMWNTGYALSRDADRSDAEIQFYIGHCLENGFGEAVCDEARARSWYEKSAAQGYEKAKEALVRLDGKVKEEEEARRKEQERLEAERKAREQAEAERKRLETERERLETERKRLEAERKAREQAEAERKAREQAEAERKAREQAEAERKRIEAERERLKTERERLEAERKRREQQEAHGPRPVVITPAVRGKAISLPPGLNPFEKALIAIGVMTAAINDRGPLVNPQEKEWLAELSLSALTSIQELQAYKLNLIQILQHADPHPDISQTFDMDSQRIAIAREMMQCIINDCNDLEQRLNRIHAILEAKGSRVHQIGNLGQIWQMLLNGNIDPDRRIERMTPKYA